MPSNKFSGRRRSHGTPKICKKPLPPDLPYPPPYHYAGGSPLSDSHWAAINSARLPAIPDPPYHEITLRNLIYHVYPHPRNDSWFSNLDQIRLRTDLFNGKRIVAIATGPHLHKPEIVRNFLGNAFKYFTFPNDPRLRQTASFLELLHRVRSTKSNEATFYAHTKGSSETHPTDENKKLAIQLWRDRMYNELLDSPDLLAAKLRHHPCLGTFKVDYSHTDQPRMLSPTGLFWGDWHYAGTFFWFRHDCIFRNPTWTFIADDMYAAESWLSGLIMADQAPTIYQPWDPLSLPPPDLYDPETHRRDPL